MQCTTWTRTFSRARNAPQRIAQGTGRRRSPMSEYIVGIDSVTRQFYRVTADSPEEAETRLRRWAKGNDEGQSVVYDGCNDTDFLKDSIGETIEIEGATCSPS